MVNPEISLAFLTSRGESYGVGFCVALAATVELTVALVGVVTVTAPF